MLVDHLVVAGDIVLFLLVGEIRQRFQPFGKGGGHKAVVRVQQVSVAGGQDPVNDRVAQPQPRFRLLLLKSGDFAVVGVDGGEQLQIVLHVLFAVKCILRQQNGQLGLNAQGGRERLVVELQTLGRELGGQIGL